jgi:hypothetical protein
MIIPNPFKVVVNDEEYLIDVEIDLGLAFPIICHPDSFKKEVIKFLESVSERRKHTVSILLIEPAPSLNTNNVVPLLVVITPIPKDHVASGDEPNYPDNEDRIIYRYRQFINQFGANG